LISMSNNSLIEHLNLYVVVNTLQDGRAALDLSLCFGRDFKSYDLVKLVKLISANRV
jgi:hypothetical protein